MGLQSTIRRQSSQERSKSAHRIHHHNPELFILDDRDQVKEKIDLNGFTRSKLIRLLEQKGFKRA